MIKLTDRLQTSEQAQRQFVSDASHELKTPLASIKLLSDSILQNDMDAETMREFVADIGNEADNYSFKPHSQDKTQFTNEPEDGNDHLMDAANYGAVTHLRRLGVLNDDGMR